jgi:2,3-bisphosphoglycerate-independent phosphoglycerate mutase
MSAAGVTDELVRAIQSEAYDFIVANYANPDMVGHTGVWAAAIAACEFVDGCLGRVADAVLGGAGVLCITADHGNADEMRDEEGRPLTAHSLNPVPFVVAGQAVEGRTLVNGVLADVAPTLLELVGLPPGEGMTGRSLLR